MNKQSGTREIDLPLESYTNTLSYKCKDCSGRGMLLHSGLICQTCNFKGYVTLSALIEILDLELETNEA